MILVDYLIWSNEINSLLYLFYHKSLYNFGKTLKNIFHEV